MADISKLVPIGESTAYDIKDAQARTDIASKISDNPTFSEAQTRANIASGESISTLFGKIKKFFTDLKTVAFTGSYSDLSDTPTIDDEMSASSTNAVQNKVIKEYIETFIQESVFEIRVESDEYALYWHGTSSECPYTITLENGEYVLNYTYGTT